MAMKACGSSWRCTSMPKVDATHRTESTEFAARPELAGTQATRPCGQLAATSSWIRGPGQAGDHTETRREARGPSDTGDRDRPEKLAARHDRHRAGQTHALGLPRRSAAAEISNGGI